jgi:hypothetical protein
MTEACTENLFMKIRSPLVGVFLLSLVLQPVSSQAANAYAVKSGNWNGDIWAASSGGTASPQVRPGEGEYENVHFRQNGVRVSVNADEGSVAQLFLNNNGTTVALLLNAGAKLNVQFLALAAGGGKSLIDINGDAVLNVGDNGVRVAHAPNGVGSMNIAEGSVTVAGRFILSGKDASGTLNLASGSLTVPFLERGSGASVFNWSGGVLSSDGADLKEINNSGGALEVGGRDSAAGTFLHKGADQTYRQGAGASMRIDIGSAKSHDAFVSEGTSGQVLLNGTIEIRLLSGYRPRAGEVFDVISAAKIVDEGVKLGGADGASFQAEVVEKDGLQVLRLKFR